MNEANPARMGKGENAGDVLSRRAFVTSAVAAATVAAAGGALAQSPSVDEIPIIDAHIHLFDGTLSLGAGYMGSPAYRAISKTSLPSMYSPQARPVGIIGAVVVESSSWIDDNLWYLQQCRTDPIMMGVSGSLNPGQSDFGRYVTHFSKDPKFRAIRSSRFYDAVNGKVTLKADQVANLKLLAEADLALDTANPTMDLMQANVQLADAIPNLRIIMDHLPSFDPTPGNQQAYEAVVKGMADRPNIFVKLTEVYHPRLTDNVIVRDYEPLRTRLDYLFGAFGEDRVMFGTDYPNSYGVATIAEEVGLMKRFFSTKSRETAEKYFWKNALRIYKLSLT
jgi:predicted TIM-barrel fold metal-dependent hydrolase